MLFYLPVESIFCFMEKISTAKKLPDLKQPAAWREFMAVDKTYRWYGCSKRRWIQGWQGLTPTQRSIMVSLWLYAGKEGVCWPSMRQLAGELGLDKSTILENIKILKQKSFFKIENQKGQKGKYHRYTLLK
jgi:DNA-binding MarR family transcriptional regulator